MTGKIEKEAVAQAQIEHAEKISTAEVAMPSETNAQAIKKRNTKFNHVWWLPLIALLIVAYIAINRYTSQGPLVTVTFNSAEGLSVENTKLRYKDLDIGKVVKIDLNDDFKGVTVSIRMNKNSEEMLHQNTRFWIVKPRFSITQISGLNTLLSGNYISIEPDKDASSDYRYTFEGLEMPPIITQNEPGLKITLLTSKAASLYPGTAVYYKGLEVGTVNRVYFSDDHLWVKADVFIAAPHDKLIQPGTKFWATSGFSIDAGTDGIAVEMESVESLFAGGITFETPAQLNPNLQKPVGDGTEFMLFANKKLAFEENTGRKHLYVTYFDGSIKGLEIGAPVMISGINVGKVKDIRLLFDVANKTTHIPVLFEVYENRLGLINTEAIADINIEKFSEQLIKQGLRTQLASANLITGTKQISLVMINPGKLNDETVASLATDKITGYPILPSTPESFDAITASVSNLVNKINQMPLEDITKNLNTLIKNANNKVDAINVSKTLRNFNALLKDGTKLSGNAQNSLKILDKSLSKMTKSVEKNLSGLSPDGPLYYNLNKTLEKLNTTLRSIKTISDMLERKPDALIFGDK